MKSKILFILFTIYLGLMMASCKKSHDEIPPPIPEDGTAVTPVGTPNGAAVVKTIGATGGNITSADARIQIIIPSGALAANKEISIQSLNNQLPGGVGNGYRLLPHGEIFAKPVTIVFNYKQEDLKGTLPEFLDVAFQNAEGSWEAMTHPVLDKVQRRITITTTHFSDWGYFKSLNLDPGEATVELGGDVNLKVTTRFPYLDPDDSPNDANTVKILKTPRELRSDEIRNWSYSGDGILISRGAQGFYTAPEEEPSTNPEAVAVNIQMHRKGQFMLVSNITILAGHNVAYLKVDENYKAPGNDGDCMLYLYGSFGNDPGAAKRSVKINGTSVVADIWAPTIIRCHIDREISGPIEISADNRLVARSVLRRYSGSFVYERFQGGVSNAGSTHPLKETTEFKIVYRGFGAPCPANVDPLFEIQAIPAFGTRADYNLSGSASVTIPAGVDPCPTTTSVSLQSTSGMILLNTIVTPASSHFKCFVEDIEGGIEVKFDFVVDDVLSGVRVQRTNCNGTSFDPDRTLQVTLEGFNLEPIKLTFDGLAGLSLMNTIELKSQPLSSNILIEAWDGTGNPSHYETDGLVPAVFRDK